MDQRSYRPMTMNIELTTRCPLHCPQCYCSLTGGKDIPLDQAIYWLREGGRMGVKDAMLSGGETMCYPHLYEVVAAAKKYCQNPCVALSGYHFTQESFEKLVDAGVAGIFISLNGSTKALNEQTRDGFELAMDALALLKENQYENTTINWVMHRSNGDDLPGMTALAERYHVKNLVVIGVKPDSAHTLHTLPLREQMYNVRDFIRQYRGPVKLCVESCFSPMLALLGETKLFGNLNVGRNKGCSAGLDAFSVNVDGLLSPCRHLEYFERFDTLEAYWDHSPVLQEIRELGEKKEEPCSRCGYGPYCRHCLAINAKINNKLAFGHETCTIFTEA